MEGLREKFRNSRNRHIAYVVFAVIMCAWVIFRFTSIAAEKNMVVYNAARSATAMGVPVDTVMVARIRGTLREPIMVKNNRALVSATRVERFAKGQKIGKGEILSVSHNLDLDTGMYVIRTYGVNDGLGYAEFTANGFVVPVYALDNGAVMVVRDGVAVRTPVDVLRQDAKKAIISSGLNNGDLVITSKVADGAKVKINK